MLLFRRMSHSEAMLLDREIASSISGFHETFLKHLLQKYSGCPSCKGGSMVKEPQNPLYTWV